MKYIVHLVRYRFDYRPVYLTEQVEAKSPQEAQMLCERQVETIVRAMEKAGAPEAVIKQARAYVTSIQIVGRNGDAGTVYGIEEAVRDAVRLENGIH